jgi:hypothetical protein
MTIDRTTLRLRTICQILLQTVNVIYRANSEVVVSVRHLKEGLQTGVVPYSDAEITEALAELVLRGLLKPAKQIVEGTHGEAGYTATQKGIDFQDHNFPWYLVDEFANRGTPDP